MIKLIQGLPAGVYWHSSNDIESEGFSNQKYFSYKTVLSGVWRQYDGGFISWTPWWFTDQPSGDKAENCAHVRLQDAHAGKWGDAPCSDTYYYICERGFWIKVSIWPPNYKCLLSVSVSSDRSFIHYHYHANNPIDGPQHNSFDSYNSTQLGAFGRHLGDIWETSWFCSYEWATS